MKTYDNDDTCVQVEMAAMLTWKVQLVSKRRKERSGEVFLLSLAGRSNNEISAIRRNRKV